MSSKLVLLLVATLAVLAALLGANPRSQALAAPVALPRPVPQDRACNEVSNAEGDDPEAGGCSTVGGFTEPLVDILPPPEK